MEVKEIPVASIRLTGLNARKDLDAGLEDSSVDDLAKSIEETGLISPIVVRSGPDGTYELIAGQRRTLAFQKLGRTMIPAIIRNELDDADATALSLIENVHRAEMNPMDKAKAIGQLNDRYDGNIRRLAKETALSEQTLLKYLKLLTLPLEIRERISTIDGPAKIDALASLASTFKNQQDLVNAYDRITGFNQTIQKEIIKRSGGDLERLNSLALEAQEGAFDMHVCRTPDDCYFIGQLPDDLKNYVMAVLLGGVDHSDRSLKEVVHRLRETKL